MVYDEDGQFLIVFLLDYWMIWVVDLLEINFQMFNVLLIINVMGIKGVGEVGIIGGCVVVMNVVQMVLKDGVGVIEIVDMLVMFFCVWDVIQVMKQGF